MYNSLSRRDFIGKVILTASAGALGASVYPYLNNKNKKVPTHEEFCDKLLNDFVRLLAGAAIVQKDRPKKYIVFLDYTKLDSGIYIDMEERFESTWWCMPDSKYNIHALYTNEQAKKDYGISLKEIFHQSARTQLINMLVKKFTSEYTEVGMCSYLAKLPEYKSSDICGKRYFNDVRILIG